MDICVFCSSSNAIDDIYFNDAERLGELIGTRGHSLINGGANVGLMEAVTIAARKSGARTIGIIPERMQERNLVSNHAHEVEITADMMERKERMRQMSDAFVALPGGFGTLEEILEVITLKQLDYHRKAIVFVNTGNFFASLFDQFEKGFSEKFSKPEYRELYFIAASPEEAMKYLESYRPGEVVTKWFSVPEK
ncbi:TIGR00730 family protein [Bacteroidales bacterium 6E]|nr:TIGR00730 family protein [Bacteroidales bacterium 6E]